MGSTRIGRRTRQTLTLQRPSCVLSDERVIRGSKTLEQCADARIRRGIASHLRIAQCNARIANQTAPFRALHRTAAKLGAEFLLRSAMQAIPTSGAKSESARSVACASRAVLTVSIALPRLESGERAIGRFAVPGANVLANVATENGVAHLRGEIARELRSRSSIVRYEMHRLASST